MRKLLLLFLLVAAALFVFNSQNMVLPQQKVNDYINFQEASKSMYAPNRIPLDGLDGLGPTGNNTSEDALATINGVVIDDQGHTVSNVSVRLVGASLVSMTDWDGKFTFRVAPGTYRPVIVEESLRDSNYLPPWNQQQPLTSGIEIPAGYYGRSVTVTRAEEQNVELKLFRKAIAHGRVVTVQGEGVPSTKVRFRSLISGVGLAYDVTTDNQGRFVVQDMIPGSYRIQLYLNETEERYRKLGAPFPADIVVEPGNNMIDDIVLGRGTGVITGRVIDQYGQPFAGLRVLAYPAATDSTHYDFSAILNETKTDVRGGFALTGLPTARVKLAIEPLGYMPYRMLYGRGANTLAAHAPQPEFAVGQSRLAVGDIPVVRNLPYYIRGEVRLGPNTRLKDVSAHLLVDNNPRSIELPISKDGTFEWSFDAPTTDSLQLQIKVAENLIRAIPIRPEPGGERYEVVQIP